MSTHVKYLLIGGGAASSAAAVAIRNADREGDVLLVGQEINRPYRRAPLNRQYLSRTIGHDDLFTLPTGWFAANHVQLRTGRRATFLDTARMAVGLDDGQEISYDRLLIATGATPVKLTVPGAALPGVHYLRTFEDANRLITAIDKAKNEGRTHDRGRGRVAVIGAGLQGAELAATLAQLGLAVELSTALAHPWGRFAGESVGGFVTRLLQANGVTVHAPAPLARFEGDGRVQRAVYADGATVDVDFAVVAMGITPAKDLLRGTSVAAERAVLVDDRGRTNVPHVFAAGDCSAWLDPRFGKHRLTDHWDSPTQTGTIAGINMAGVADAKLDDVTTFSSMLFDVTLSGIGEPRFVDHRLVRGVPGSPDGFIEIGLATDGRVSQVLVVGREPDPATLALVRDRVNLSGREEEVKEPNVPL
jgi:NADPH-dependent 2,4-dienoyl-CoA reductase/sulfur reductase-like enzyme